MFEADRNAVALLQISVETLDPREKIFGVDARIERVPGHLYIDGIAVSAEHRTAPGRRVGARATNRQPAGTVEFYLFVQHQFSRFVGGSSRRRDDSVDDELQILHRKLRRGTRTHSYLGWFVEAQRVARFTAAGAPFQHRAGGDERTPGLLAAHPFAIAESIGELRSEE